jgi:rRNA pseudouridine-1189 N-methylase Emg1 (Nep1/Mra1 family)
MIKKQINNYIFRYDDSTIIVNASSGKWSMTYNSTNEHFGLLITMLHDDAFNDYLEHYFGVIYICSHSLMDSQCMEEMVAAFEGDMQRKAKIEQDGQKEV